MICYNKPPAGVDGEQSRRGDLTADSKEPVGIRPADGTDGRLARKTISQDPAL